MFRKTGQLFIIIFSINSFSAVAQNGNDTVGKQLDEVVITATRTERKLSNVAVPVQVVSQKIIRQSGSLRLTDILGEQTGLYLTNNFGNGIQLQGLSADYVLILIDGEPLVGRNAGVLNLSRITVNNIKQIEVVKGPSSSLYGSEAMGGVINIITDKNASNALAGNFRMGSYGSADANINGSFSRKGFSSSYFLNRNSSSGYDFNRFDTGMTAQPFVNYTAQIRLQQEFCSQMKAGLQLRYFQEKQENLYKGGSDMITGRPVIAEYNINPYFNWKIGKRIQTALRGYLTQYEADTKDYLQRKDSLYYYDFFQQRFARIESQTDLQLSAGNALTIGGGYTHERLNTNRYSGIRKNNISYLYLQDEHRIANSLTLIGGLRYDKNAAYESRLSPKLAIQWQATSALHLRASYGAGFKAPDYRQLYLNFTNNAAGGYTVYGANEVSYAQLLQQQQAGIITSITPFGQQMQLLRPEYSQGFNLGADYRFSKKLQAKMNLFRNDIDNLISTQVIAYKPSNAQVFSYFNINSALTEGGDVEIKYQHSNHLRMEAGYQYLLTADKSVLDKVRNGELFGRIPGSLIPKAVSRGEYGGLPDRSRHTANLKLFYERDKWFANARAIYRSRRGVSDVDGNLILNRDDEYAKGFMTVNLSGGYSINKIFQVQAGIDNITGYRDKQFLPNQPGRTFYINLACQFFQTLKSNN